jgi:predicted RNA-binding protein Jag
MYSARMESAVETILKELLEAANIPYSAITRSELAGQVIFSIETTGEGHALIANNADTLHALDHLVKKIVENRTSARSITQDSQNDEREHLMYLIDVNEHRIRQIKELQTKAIMMAERARSFQYDVELTPMSSYERLIIHTTLQDAPNVKTESQGEGRDRRVVIKYSA